MDKNLFTGTGSIDAFVEGTYAGKTLKTSVVKMDKQKIVNWNEEFCFPCQIPIMASRVVMKVYDEDALSNEVVGSILFSMKECVGKKNGTYFWKNVYGAPLGYSGDNVKKMNKAPDSASAWKGRMLMKVTAEKSEKPFLKQQPLEEPDLTDCAQFLVDREFEIMVEVGMGISLPDDKKYKVKVKVAEQEIITDFPKFMENNYNRWGWRTPEAEVLKAPYRDVYDIG